MSVAEQTESERIQRTPEAQLAGASLLGALFLLAALYGIFGLLPTMWNQLFESADRTKEVMNPFLSGSLLLMVTCLAIAGLGYLSFVLEKKYTQKGLRAGSFIAAMLIFFVFWICVGIGNTLEDKFDLAVGVVVVGLIVAGLGFLGFKLFLLSGFRDFLIGLEDQGWFSLAPFKSSQGHKVRRATIMGILTVGMCGIYVLIVHRTLGSGLTENNWGWWVPFTRATADDGSVTIRFLTLLYKVNVTVPLLLAVALLWFAWRIVNWPAFADFLIATEAEINKVSWTTRKRLVTDTIVVLVTVFVLTAYLFIVDLLWIQVLSNRFISVLYVDPRAEQMKQNEKTLW